MNVEKRYWQWSERLNETEFKLGGDIFQLIEKGLVKKTNENLLYKGNDKISDPWHINVDGEGRVISISYREFFLPLVEV